MAKIMQLPRDRRKYRRLRGRQQAYVAFNYLGRFWLVMDESELQSIDEELIEQMNILLDAQGFRDSSDKQI